MLSKTSLDTALREISSLSLAEYKKRNAKGPLTYCVYFMNCAPADWMFEHDDGLADACEMAFSVGADHIRRLGPGEVPRTPKAGIAVMYPRADGLAVTFLHQDGSTETHLLSRG